jgi:thioredoxin reductase (NADPH)
MFADDPEAFPTLTKAELALAERHGSRQSIKLGEYLFRQGDATTDFYVVLSGAVEIVVHAANEDRVIVRHGPGRFIGELSLVSGLRVFVSARVVEVGEVVVLSRHALRELIATQPSLGDTVLKALMARRTLLLTSASESLQLVGSRFSPETRRIREFLVRSHIPHEWLDPDHRTRRFRNPVSPGSPRATRNASPTSTSVAAPPSY